MKHLLTISSLASAWVAIIALSAPRAQGASLPEDQQTFFENKIRPVLAQACYECHSVALKKKGGLLLDSRPGWQAGGDTGPAIVPGKPSESLLIQAIRYEHDDLKMPKNGAKLDDKVIADFEKWIAMGAPDPRDTAPSKEEVARETDWHAILERRKRESWCFQPIAHPAPPAVQDAAWSQHPVDHFLLAEMERRGLKPAAKANGAIVARRLSYIITGLPPSPTELQSFAATYQTNPEQAVAHYADQLLNSPRFGECWSRHWMDWMRYAESHGSEGDPAIPFAWRYRDYLIRALNQDVPYNQLVREQIAGDLLPHPRINAQLGINESALGTGQYRFVFHGFTPTDALDELVSFTDNQIDVLSKSFLGVTVTCAHCHNHKFDPISQTDYYAMFGIMASCRPALIDVDTPEKQQTNNSALAALKPRIRQMVAAAWLTSLADLPQRLQHSKPSAAELKDASSAHTSLAAWNHLHKLNGAAFSTEWQNQLAASAAQRQAAEAFQNAPTLFRWDAHQPESPHCYYDGNDVPQSTPAGEYSIAPNGSKVIEDIYPAGRYSHLLSSKHRGVFASPRFRCEGGQLWVRVAGGGDSRVRYVVQNYPRSGLIFPKQDLSSDQPKWIKWDMDYWKGDMLRLEAATNADEPIEGKNVDRSWFGVMDMVYTTDKSVAPAPDGVPLPALLPQNTPAPADATALAELYQSAAESCIKAWRDGTMSDTQAEFLSDLVRHNLVPNSLDQLGSASDVIAEYRRLEAEIPVPTRAPGVLEADAFDQPLFVRGNHKQPSDTVPRRFLDAIDPAPYHSQNSGRLQLAESIVSPTNPLTSRVIVNRLWHYVFGRGLVATTDNFGKLGEAPTHPELLDYLATQFTASGGSLKAMIRTLVTTQAFREGSHASTSAAEKDPEDLLLSHFPVRRLDAEAIRDSMVDLSGTLDDHMYGEPVASAQPRRSVYLHEIRNRLDPFLTAFDAPVPSSTRGRRDSTTVPAQSLALLNDPNVLHWSELWAKRTLADTALPDDAARLAFLYQTSLGRQPSPSEAQHSLAYLQTLTGESNEAAQKLATLEGELEKLRSQVHDVMAPARAALVKAQHPSAAQTKKSDTPEPYAEWVFSKGLEDLRGHLPLQLKGNARLEDGALTLDGQGYAVSRPLPIALHEKTLDAWVQLDNLTQNGAGVMSIQANGGDTFDAIVFAEKKPREWLAGSNFFKRTKDFGGKAEDEASNRPVHLTMVYTTDGSIAAYRNGHPYGKPYPSSGLADYNSGVSEVLLGLRHGRGVGGNRALHGRILTARLYDHALTATQIEDSGDLPIQGVSDAQVLDSLPPQQRNTVQSWREELSQKEHQLQELQSQVSPLSNREAAWASLAHALFNTKEFIYLR